MKLGKKLKIYEYILSSGKVTVNDVYKKFPSYPEASIRGRMQEMVEDKILIRTETKPKAFLRTSSLYNVNSEVKINVKLPRIEVATFTQPRPH